VVASDVLRCDPAHSLGFGAGGRAERGKAAEESEFGKEFAPWGDCHCCPPWLARLAFVLNHSGRHARVCRGHPCLSWPSQDGEAWMAGTSPAMTTWRSGSI